jgi:rhodanese-related sulfurtransferase
MKRSIFLLLSFASLTMSAQFKADNVKYTTVFPEDLCKTLMANKGYLILDVRSPGEFDDTSSSTSLNIGHLRNAKNINITQLPQRWKEISSYKDQPVFIYCSHSQRSRRASRLLTDSGFTHVYNINGGLTDFYNQGIQSNPCAGFEIETSVPYKIISPKQFAEGGKAKSYYIIDLRSDSIFKGISTERSRIEGKFADAVNMPFEKWSATSDITIPGKPVLLVDEFGSESPAAAKMLLDKGIKDVTILFDGMDAWVDYATNAGVRPSAGWERNIQYNLLPAESFNKMVAEKKEFALIDVRTKEEFANTSKNSWQNIGQVTGAINIPSGELKTSTSLPPSKDVPVIVYGFNSQPEIFESAKWFKDQGYKNVSVLYGGIWRLRWVSHNIKGKAYLNDLVMNVPPQNE